MACNEHFYFVYASHTPSELGKKYIVWSIGGVVLRLTAYAQKAVENKQFIKIIHIKLSFCYEKYVIMTIFL